MGEPFFLRRERKYTTPESAPVVDGPMPDIEWPTEPTLAGLIFEGKAPMPQSLALLALELFDRAGARFPNLAGGVNELGDRVLGALICRLECERRVRMGSLVILIQARRNGAETSLNMTFLRLDESGREISENDFEDYAPVVHQLPPVAPDA